MEKYQTFGARIVSTIIDSFITIPIGIVASIASLYGANPKLAFLSSGFISLLSVFYYILMHARYGQTLGKMAMKIKVLDVSENPITFAQAVIRSLPQMLPVFLMASVSISKMSDIPNQVPSYQIEAVKGFLSFFSLFWCIAEIIVCLISTKRRALHDFIAGTVVIKTNV